MPVLEIDCTRGRLPAGVRIAECRRFSGWSIEAARSFAAGETVYRHPVRLVSPDTEVRLRTELGTRHCTFEDHGLEIVPSSLDHLAPELLAELAEHCGLEASDRAGIWSAVTGNGARRFLCLGFDELVNHSPDPNCAAALLVSLDLSGPEPRGEGELRALRAVSAGDELTVDYRTFSGPWVPPAGWSA
jgi:hypothetical protein